MEEYRAFPFQTQLSFHKLHHFWKEQLNSEDKQWVSCAETVLNAVGSVPELSRPIVDDELAIKHRDVARLFFSALFPAASWNNENKAIMEPFAATLFYGTPQCCKLMQDFSSQLLAADPADMDALWHKKVNNAYLAILKEIYKVDVEYEIGMTIPLLNTEDGLTNYYHIALNLDFVDVECIGELPVLSHDDIQHLLINLDDLDLWMQKLPPELFRFNGFTVLSPVDITETYTSSLLKQELLQRDALIDPDKFLSIRQNIRNILRLPELKVGIGAPSANGEEILMFGPDDQHVASTIKEHMSEEDFGPMVCDMMSTKRPVVVQDVNLAEMPDKLREELLKKKIKNYVLLALELDEDERALGLLQLAAPYANKLNHLTIKKLDELIPILATAVRESTQEVENEIQNVILSKFTALHKTVEWKFREVAKEYRDWKLKGKEIDLPPILFDNVYPLYGVSDIRNSSNIRKAAIQKDMILQLKTAKKVLEKIIEFKALPVYEEFAYQVDKKLAAIKKRMITQDEGALYEFFSGELEPMFRHVTEAHPELKETIDSYFDKLDADLGLLYHDRKAYEDSVSVINSEIYSLLEAEELRVQDMFPYYFENYKTDGVEYNIYIGQSLVNDRVWDPIYLHNLRLWQLILMCKIARRSAEIKPQLQVPLDTAHLVLVQSTPLSIRFRNDEKKFDVDGAYNVRYEIMKKRVDKAIIKGKKERLTQPGMIAIVYSNPKDLREYQKYLEYLVHLNCIKPDFELLDLEELQGVEGLKAIRVEVVQGDEAPDFSESLLSEIESKATAKNRQQ